MRPDRSGRHDLLSDMRGTAMVKKETHNWTEVILNCALAHVDRGRQS